MVALVQHVGGTATGSTCDITLSATGAGNALIVVASYNATTDADLGGVTLGGSGTGWSSQKYFEGTDAYDQAVWANYDIAGSQTALVVTGHSGDGVTNMMVDVFEVSGGITTLDQFVQVEVDGTSGSWSSGATGTTSAAAEFIIGFVNAYNNAGATFTLTGPTSPWTSETTLRATSSGGYPAQLTGYQVSASEGTFTFSGTASTTGSNLYYQAGVLTFKGGASVTSSGSVAMPAMAVSGSMTVPPPVTSSGSVAMPPMGVSGSAGLPVTSSGSVAMPSIVVAGAEVPFPWTYNLCPNPSFEAGLTGWSALTGTTLLQDTTQGYAGHASLQVETDGTVAGQGVYGPEVTVPSTGLGSMSLYILGPAGSITVSAVSGDAATVLASTNVNLLGGNYQRVILSGLPLTSGQPMYVVVQTTTAQEMSFWVDAVQYEMDSPAHAYIDGSFLTCVWSGFPDVSSSYLPYPFGTSASGAMALEGQASPVSVGESFGSTAEGSMTLSGTESGTTTVDPVGALTDFSMWTPADMDPAVSYPAWSNALASSGETGWNRIYGVFGAPLQYDASDGVLWSQAAYAAVGFEYISMPNTAQQSLSDVQFEVMPLPAPGSTPAPTNWYPPRQIRTTVKPTRLNFCPNPSIEVSTSGWIPVGTGVLARDNSITAAQGSYSMKVAVHAAGDGCYIVISDLIYGDTYIASAQVQGGAGLQDVVMSISGASSSSAQQGIPYGGDAILGIGYGQGPYGGVEGTGDMPTGQWFNPNCVFTAQESTVILSFQSLAGSDISYPAEFWVDAVLIEAGETLGTYFDGSWGTDYSWETGGTSGLARSYYYDRQEVSAGAVNDVLAQHTPLGITAATPVFSSPYTQ